MLKKLILFLLLLYVYFFLKFPVFAFEFIKSSYNPLSINLSLDYGQILQIHIYKEGSLYKGIATAKKSTQSYYSLVAIESADGKTWSQTREILTSPDFDVSNARLFIDREGNQSIYFSKMDSNDLYRIYKIDCNNELNCSQTPTLVLDPNLSDYNQNRGFFAPFIFDTGNDYYLFYGAWGNNGFRLNLARSSDLSNWIKCDREIMTGGDGPFPYIEGNNLYLFVHRSNATGIQVLKTNTYLSCDSLWENLGYIVEKNQTYDQKHIIFPSVINDEGQLKLYYSGLGNDNTWRLNLAETVPIPTTTPTPSPTFAPVITPTITPELTPTTVLTQNKSHIILIPGFMASWNKDAILHNKTVDYQDWKLGSYVKEYRGIIETLKNLGYEENKNLFVFAYDWRQKVDASTDSLNQFIESKIPKGQKIDIIGHSLGGVIGRIYSQKYKNQDRVNNAVTIASPHYGTVQVYKPLEAGEIDRDNTWLWLAEKLIINLNRGLFESDREVIEHLLPVTRDLFPTFNFLRNENGEQVDKSTLHISNVLLDYYNNEFNTIFSLFTALVGEKDGDSTLAGYKVINPNTLDNLLSNYKDDRPVESYKDNGDYVVLAESAKTIGDEFQTLSLDHGEIIYKKVGIAKILDILNINYLSSQIVEGEPTIISPSLIFMIKSPAIMTVTLGDKIYEESGGMIFIENAEPGNYNLSVHGIDYGYYEIQIGQISETEDKWETIEGKIEKNPPTTQIDTYTITYSKEASLDILPTLTPTFTPTPTLNPTQTPTSTPTLMSSPQPTPIIYQSIDHLSENLSGEVLGENNKNESKNDGKSNAYIIFYPIAFVSGMGVSWWYSRKKREGGR